MTDDFDQCGLDGRRNARPSRSPRQLVRRALRATGLARTATYLYGYGSPTLRLTLAELEKRATWYNLDPEFRRRQIALFDASGGTVGIGGGWRSRAQQAASYAAEQKVRPGSKRFAPAGKSWHEESTPDGKGLAGDLIGDLDLANRLAPQFGLRHFANNSFPEKWHHQPLEIPKARPQDAVARLKPWPLPGVPRVPLPPEPTPIPPIPQPIPEEDEDMKMVIKGTDAAHHTVLVVIDGAGTHMTGLNNASDEKVMCALVGQDAVRIVSNVLWDDLRDKAVASMPK